MKNRSQQGYSLIELMVAAGMAMSLILLISTWLTRFMKDVNDLESKIFNEAAAIASIRTVVKDVAKAGPSYGRLDMVDDNSKVFFDWYPDMPLSAFAASSPQRIITITVGSGYFYFMTSLASIEKAIDYDPVAAYTYSAHTDKSKNATRTYSSVNSPIDRSDTTSEKIMTSRFPNLWKPGQLFAVYSPQKERSEKTSITTADFTEDKTAAPHDRFVLARVNSSDDLDRFSKHADATTKAKLGCHEKDPVTSGTYDDTDDNLDDFFQRLPPVGGAAPKVRIEPVQIIRYSIVADSSLPVGTGKLISEVYDLSGTTPTFQSATVIDTKVKKVEFTRPNLAMPITQVNTYY